jgi:hypothetical protein
MTIYQRNLKFRTLMGGFLELPVLPQPFRRFSNLVPHTPVPCPTFVPHPEKARIVFFDVVVDTDVLFICVLAVKASGLLLQGSLPRDRHRQ